MGSDVIFAVMMVRNEADVLRVNVLHHLALGVDRFLIVDNGSTDGTDQVLDELRKTGRVQWQRREGKFEQAATTTELAREAFLQGARWVLPTDADEFWWATGGAFREILENSSAGALTAQVVNFIQRREQEVAEPRALLTMTRRVPRPIGSVDEGPHLVEAGRIGYVEMRYPPKCISRASIGLSIGQGNHTVTGVLGALETSSAIVCLHAPLRARSTLLSAKVEHGRRVEEIEHYLKQAWHVRRWRRLSSEGRMHEEWEANSYRDDHLDVYGEEHRVTVDPRLRDVVSPWIEGNGATGGVAARVLRTPVTATAKSAEVDPEEDGDPALIASIVTLMRQVEGWLRDEEAELLIQFIRRSLKEHGIAPIVEIGSYCGKSTIVLAAAAKSVAPEARVYAIDPHRGEVGAADTSVGVETEGPTLGRFLANVSRAGVADVVQPIVARSLDAVWTQPIAFLFLDGLHDYSSVSQDFARFERWLPNGGYVAFHDCDENHPGVRACVEGILALGRYCEVARRASLVVLRKGGLGTRSIATVGAEEFANLLVRVAQQDKGIAFLRSEIAANESSIREREKGIEWLQGVIANHEAAIAERDKGIAWLRGLVEERDRSILWLQGEASRGAEAAAELSRLRSSRLWRILRFCGIARD